MKRDYRLFLQDILDACRYILEFVEGMGVDAFANDEKTSSAVIQKFEVIDEATKKEKNLGIKQALQGRLSGIQGVVMLLRP